MRLANFVRAGDNDFRRTLEVHELVHYLLCFPLDNVITFIFQGMKAHRNTNLSSKSDYN